MGWARGQATLLPEESVTPVPSLYRSVPAFVRLALDAVATFEGSVEAGDSVRLVHTVERRPSATNREEISPGAAELTASCSCSMRRVEKV